MGLDMYLSRTVVISTYDYMEQKKPLAEMIIKCLGGDPKDYKDGIVEIKLPQGYWRKANQIHGWFVDNVQNGVDDCDRYEVSKEKLIELKQVCQSVLDGKAKPKDVLPPRKGFFFGTYDIDKDYIDDLRNTVEIVDKALNQKDMGIYADNFQYQSSW